MMKYGVIGLGNMASAIVLGMHKNGMFENNSICGYDCDEKKMQALADQVGLQPCASARDVVLDSDVVLLAVKPQVMPDVLLQIKDAVDSTKLIVTIAAGKPLAFYEQAFGEKQPVVRVMPNINARVQAAASAICPNEAATQAQTDIVRAMFESIGRVWQLPEQHFAAFAAIGGASGAFVYLYIDALASAGVKAGLPRDLAQEIACATVLGSAKLQMASDEHPARLCDQVCSPGGTTIEGVHVLKKLGFESAVQQAIDAIIEKDHKLAK